MTRQNTSSAVMSQRTKERPPHPLEAQFAKVGLDRYMLDDFPTQPWGGRAWCEHVADWKPLDSDLRHKSGRGPLVWEPGANRGFLVRGLQDYCDVVGSDIFDYGAGFKTFNFLDLHPSMMGRNDLPAFVPRRPDWIVFNPPFVRAQEFIETAVDIAIDGVAALCRAQIMETVGRYEKIFAPKNRICWAWSQFVERLPMHEAKCERDMSTASAYGWLTIWKKPFVPAWILDRRHIPPCRARLEKPDDYR